MSEKKSNEWFSTKKVLEELNAVTIEELETFESAQGTQTNGLIEGTKQQTEQKKADSNEEGIVGQSINEVEQQEISKQEELIDQLTFEIKELILENEKLQENQNQFQHQHTILTEMQKDLEQVNEELRIAQNSVNALEKQREEENPGAIETMVKELEQSNKEAASEWAKEKQVYEQLQVEQAEYLRQKDKEIEELKATLENKTKQLEQQILVTPTEEQEALQATIDELRQENDALQVEISEVLVFARRKANRTVQEAKIESERMIRTTEMRIDAVHDRAKEILFEVEETKGNVLTLFEDLNDQIHQLSDKKLLFEDFDN
ncbi:hypothetical protein D922_01576 [Enterococcus faecalis 06-MB-DW-09]|nr:hypothetical protein D922_01576 [Enterococcus faecalis 06-MB-DW-09]